MSAAAPLPDPWTAWSLCALVAAIAFAGVAHGVMGFGFPLLSTPLVALFTDVRTAVLITLLPNMLLNLMSILRGAQWTDTLRRHWPVAAWVFAGTLAGSRVLVYASPTVLRCMLAAMIVVYLVQSRARSAGGGLERFVQGRPRLAQAVFGSLGGFFAGTVNVALPPLLIYYASLALAPVVMTQALNLSFLVGRVTQALAVAAAGRWSQALIGLSLPLCLLAVLALRLGFRLQARVPPRVFLRILRGTLWSMAALLAWQAWRG